jgi:integrase
VQPRQLPDDETILSWFYKIKNPAWRWVYGMLATYGLRNHEVFRLNFESLKETSPVIEVLEGKTGDRRIWACYPEWVEDFQLLNVQLPPIRLDRSNSAIGSSCGHYFKTQVALPFPLYSLCHCWAIRTLEFGLDITLAAQQMGHSVAVHSDLYHRWISDRHHQKAFETLMMRENRPKPPILKGK